MMLATVIFMGVALALAAFLVIFGMRTSREEQRMLILAQEREHTARQDAEKARATRALLEAKFAADIDAQLAAAADDPRGIGDGLGRDHVAREPDAPATRTGRFRREAPAPLPTARDRG